MFQQFKIAAVIPAYNEEKFIENVVNTLPAFIDCIIVVNDGSLDATGDVLLKLQKNNSKLIILSNEKSRGVGFSISKSYSKALSLSCDYAAVLAGDGQMDPSELSCLLALMINRNADYLKGNRIAYPGVKEVMPPLRYWGNRILGGLTGWLASLPELTDSQCGYTILKMSVWNKQDWKLYPRYGYPNDLLIKLSHKSCKIIQTPVRPVYGKEVSGIRTFPFIKALTYIFLRGAVSKLKLKFRRGADSGQLIHIECEVGVEG